MGKIRWGICLHRSNRLCSRPTWWSSILDVPDVEDELTKDVDFGVIESSKVASELFAPLSGEVVEANDEKLEDEPEYVNEAPYDAWICKIKVADMAEYEALLTAEQYEASLAE